MSPEDVRAALTVYVGEDELRKKTRLLEDAGVPTIAVDAYGRIRISLNPHRPHQPTTHHLYLTTPSNRVLCHHSTTLLRQVRLLVPQGLVLVVLHRHNPDRSLTNECMHT